MKMTIKEAAEYLRIHEKTMWRYVSEGKVPACKFGDKLILDKDELDAYLEANRVIPKEVK